ncbi:DNA-binding domain of ModE / Molybdate-binding domain of ModE [hydrothermal vent metagenome]|uniref:DNA-binding domain of ModE / Molybdate-binding domain of ModE n=1 Tax=hydrothermal vent metagenome TaxID=652676 RepID=A0A1W1E8D6_9ZZZZ
MELASTLSLEMFGKPFLLKKRIRLLHAIDEYGSISKAAKAVPMSYKSAWEAVDAMNALSPEPIVNRETGGKEGGGTVLTAYGKRLLQHYALLEEEHSRFIARLASLVGEEEGTFGTLGRFALQLSARNQIQAVVTQVHQSGVNAEVTLQLKGSQRIISHITAEAVEDMQIETGSRVVAVCKSSNLFVLHPEEVQSVNLLEGSVTMLEKDEKHVKLTVDIGGQDTVISVAPLSTYIATLKTGEKVRLGIKPRDIMIGR